MTAYDFIRSLNIEEMAEFLYEICHQKDLDMVMYLNERGIKTDLIEVSKDIQVQKHINYLLSEME